MARQKQGKRDRRDQIHDHCQRVGVRLRAGNAHDVLEVALVQREPPFGEHADREPLKCREHHRHLHQLSREHAEREVHAQKLPDAEHRSQRIFRRAETQQDGCGVREARHHECPRPGRPSPQTRREEQPEDDQIDEGNLEPARVTAVGLVGQQIDVPRMKHREGEDPQHPLPRRG